MKAISIKPEIHSFPDFKSFAEEFKLGQSDLVLTHEFLYEPYMKPLGLGCGFIFQEKFGAGEPSDKMVDAIYAEAAKYTYNRVVAVGGGTVVDIGKLLSLKKLDKIADMLDGRVAPERVCGLVIVPTTCGTGSEVTNLTILEYTAKHTKQGIAANALYADYAVLIPELVRNLPYPFFMYSSIDALIHAMESMLSPKSNGYTELFALKAIEIILKGYKTIVAKGPDSRKEIIGDFLTASNYAGIAFGNTGVGAVHAMSYPLGGSYHVPHGEANYEMLTKVFSVYNKKNPTGKISSLNAVLADALGVPNDDKIYDNLEKTLSTLIVRKPLREFGMKPEECESFADSVIEKQQRLLVNNYVELTRDEIAQMYKELY